MTLSTSPDSPVGARGRAARLRRAGASYRRRLALHRADLEARSGDILAGILKISSEGVLVADSDLRIQLFSKGAEEIFGYAAQEVIGRPLEMLIPAEHRAGHRSQANAFAQGPVQSRRMGARSVVHGLAKSGALLPLEIGLSRLETPQGMIFTALVRDISDRRAVEAALEAAAAQAQAANEAKSLFLAAMSHEIRTPLNGVLGMAQAMGMGELSPAQRERLDVIRQSGEGLLAILNDLLDLSKIEAGKLSVEDTEFDLDDLAAAAHATFAALAASKGLAFSLTVSPGARGVYRGDPLRIRQILHNLMSNAVKFTERGEVRVEIGRKRGMLILEVRDTGVGVPRERAARLFQKFEQADASTTRRFGGTGLGLAICRHLAEMMGGHITLISREGEGSTFCVELAVPRVGNRRRKPDARAPAAQLPVARDLRVLVAEDNSMNQLVLRTLLSQIAVEPVIVGDGRAAVEAWAQGTWDLILMDVQMPEMDGPTAVGVIRGREAAEGRTRTPIYALTANAMAHHRAEYERVGMDGMISKPVEVEKLFALIESIAATAPPAQKRA